MADSKTEVDLDSGNKMIIEQDVAAPMRDGAFLYADISRPENKGRVPAILNTSSCQEGKVWGAHDYAGMRVGTRGSGKSPGQSDPRGSAPYTHYPAAYNAGAKNAVRTGGKMASYLLLPIISSKSRKS